MQSPGQNNPARPSSADQECVKFLAAVAAEFARKSFRPHPVFKGGHGQTLAAYAWPRRYRLRKQPQDEERLFNIEPNIQVLAHCRWQPNRLNSPTVVLWHGIEGSTTSIYMIAMADKAFRAGFNVVRVNLRNCGGTEHLTPTLYHGGMSDDMRIVLNELIEKDKLTRIFPIGFSLSGNTVLKLAGEYGQNAPREIIAVCAVSPSVDLAASTELIVQRENWIYHQDFVRRLKNRIRVKHASHPDLYDLSKLPLVRTIRDFDEHYTSIANGYMNADDYYYRCSALRVVKDIRLPTLVIHATDDPFIPVAPLRNPDVVENPHILLIETEGGGHVGFISAERDSETALSADESRSRRLMFAGDRFWAENRAVEFCLMANERLGI